MGPGGDNFSCKHFVLKKLNSSEYEQVLAETWVERKANECGTDSGLWEPGQRPSLTGREAGVGGGQS